MFNKLKWQRLEKQYQINLQQLSEVQIIKQMMELILVKGTDIITVTKRRHLQVQKFSINS